MKGRCVEPNIIQTLFSLNCSTDFSTKSCNTSEKVCLSIWYHLFDLFTIFILNEVFTIGQIINLILGLHNYCIFKHSRAAIVLDKPVKKVHF